MADGGVVAGATSARGKSRLKPFLIALGVITVLLLIGGGWWLHARHYESTDDAYIDADVSGVAPRVSGEVTQVLVADNQPVAAGDLLVQLDDSASRAQLAAAQAAAAQAAAQIAGAQTQIEVAQAQRALAEASAAGPDAQAANAARDLRRFAELQRSAPGAVTQQQVDQARTAQSFNAAQAQAAHRQVAVADAQIAAAEAQLTAAHAQMRAAQAQIDAAQLQIDYARVTAPVAGHVAHKRVSAGDYATLGQELLSVVPDQIWITANFKETQLDRMRPGQSVSITVDAYPGVKFTGHVQSIQRGAGQAFDLLPPQNATGNFVKVVQRVPVKILFDGTADAQHLLGPGMSVVPVVKVD